MVPRIGMTMLAVLFLAAFSARASAEGEECTSDNDCGEGEQCMMMPCAAPPCDPDDENCEEIFCEPEGMCMANEEPWESECETDDDCPSGFVCEDIGGVACAIVACPEGIECPEVPDCEEEVFYGCVPAPCSSDADCGQGLICLTITTEMCWSRSSSGCSSEEDDCMDGGSDSGGADDCMDGGSDFGGEDDCMDGGSDFSDPECVTHTESFCAPPYLAPCTQNADCGEGFNCVEAQSCVCSGGGAIDEPPSTGGSSGASESRDDSSEPSETPPEPDCTCEPAGEFYCEPQEIVCDDDGDCPEGWECEDFGDITMPCSVDENGVVDCEEAPSEEIPDMCMPPYWDIWTAGGSSTGYTEAMDEATGGENSRAMPRVNADDDADVRVEGGGMGCQVVAGSSTWMAGVLGLFALVAALRRRK